MSCCGQGRREIRMARATSLARLQDEIGDLPDMRGGLFFNPATRSWQYPQRPGGYKPAKRESQSLLARLRALIWC
jgi:hypothetical protein